MEKYEGLMRSLERGTEGGLTTEKVKAKLVLEEKRLKSREEEGMRYQNLKTTMRHRR
jgi:hypothetical protein